MVMPRRWCGHCHPGAFFQRRARRRWNISDHRQVYRLRAPAPSMSKGGPIAPLLEEVMTSVTIPHGAVFEQSAAIRSERFARVVFRIAGIWGVLIMTPLFFTFDAVGHAYPPPITHPDLYYGFVGVTLVWRLAFLIISPDPPR